VNSLSFGEVDGIVCVSGDGIVHEVVNGLILRKDWEKMSQIPIGLIPAGRSTFF
jgi:sphingosine kinase